jgi:hypothetical protein
MSISRKGNLGTIQNALTGVGVSRLSCWRLQREAEASGGEGFYYQVSPSPPDSSACPVQASRMTPNANWRGVSIMDEERNCLCNHRKKLISGGRQEDSIFDENQELT